MAAASSVLPRKETDRRRRPGSLLGLLGPALSDIKANLLLQHFVVTLGLFYRL
jgi:hypothetical protein